MENLMEKILNGDNYGTNVTMEQQLDLMQQSMQRAQQQQQYDHYLMRRDVLGVQQSVENLTTSLKGLGYKKRKMMTGRNLAVLNNGQIGLVTNYSDGTSTVVEFIPQSVGVWHVYDVEIAGQKRGLFVIGFPNINLWIFGKRSNVRRRYLQERFVKSGVIFSPTLSMKVISDVLFQTFAPQIENPMETLKIDRLAGWQGEEFRYAENFPHRFLSDFIEMPIAEKHFLEKRLSAESCLQYFEKLRNLSDLRMRLLVMTYPFVGMLSSLLKRQEIELTHFVNLVDLANLPQKEICKFFQIFNRQHLGAFNPDVSQKRIEEILNTVKDEIFIGDFRVVLENSNYKKKKLEETRRYMGNVLTGCTMLEGGNKEVSAGFVAISSTMIDSSNAINILIDEELKAELLSCAEVLNVVNSEIFYEFMVFVQKNFAEVNFCIGKNYTDKNKKLNCFWSVFRIVEKFWRSFEVDLKKAAAIPETVDFSEIFEEGVFDDLQEQFKNAVRRGVERVVFRNRKEGTFVSEQEILFDEEFLYFPTSLLKKLVIIAGIRKEFTRILYELKESATLITEKEGLAKKVQLGGKRLHVYQIRKAFFNSTGFVDIVELGKEVGNEG